MQNASPELIEAIELDIDKVPTERELRHRLRKSLRAGKKIEGRPSFTRKALTEELRKMGFQSVLEKRWMRIARSRLGGSASEDDLPSVPNDVIRIEVRYRPWPYDDWQEVEDSIRTIARERRDQIREAFRDAGFYHWPIEPQLTEHIHWLFRRICPQEGVRYPTPWSQIARDAGVTVTAVTRAVAGLAKEMGIELPAAPPGRPPKFPR